MKKKKLLIFTLYHEIGASSNYRILMYAEDLKKQYDVKVCSFWSNKYVERYMNNKKKYAFHIILEYIRNYWNRIFQFIFIAPKYDLVFIQKTIIPKSKISFFKYLRLFKLKIIFDIDDAVYTNKRDNSDKIAKNVDFILAGNPMLKTHYGQMNQNIILFPTVDFSPSYQPFIKNNFETKIIGWIGSQATIDNLDLIIDAINKLVEKHPEVRFHFISNAPLKYEMLVRNSKFIKWSKDSYIKDMSDFTVGIMPLKQSGFNEGKCGFKLIQYLNLEKPVIASDVGINKEIVSDYGFIANNKEEWINMLEKLLFDEACYKTCVSNINLTFSDRYSYERNLSKLISIFNEF